MAVPPTVPWDTRPVPSTTHSSSLQELPGPAPLYWGLPRASTVLAGYSPGIPTLVYPPGTPTLVYPSHRHPTTALPVHLRHAHMAVLRSS